MVIYRSDLYRKQNSKDSEASRKLIENNQSEGCVISYLMIMKLYILG